MDTLSSNEAGIQARSGDSSAYSDLKSSSPSISDSPQKKQPKKRKRKLLAADLFCGAGGFSTALMRSLSEDENIDIDLVCVNHWPVAIETHTKNHPDARHICADLEGARPEELVPEGKLDILLASPTCTYHSRARGGKPTTDQQRMDPWIVTKWCTILRTKILIVENVPEFVEWGPINMKTGRPMKSRKGEYFQAWVKALKAIGFNHIEWRTVCAADYGDATTRNRFFMIARSDGKRIKFPTPTHAPADRSHMLGLKPWRVAREIIDWSLDGTSIFDRPRPLSPNTIRRIAAGAVKFKWPDPFMVVLRNHCDALSVDTPIPTVTASGTHIGLAQPEARPFTFSNASGGAPRDVNDPIPSFTTTSRGIGLAEPVVMQTDQTGSKGVIRSADEPLQTIVTKRNAALAQATIELTDDDGRLQKAASQGRLISIDGVLHVLDIRFRMLKNHELAAAMSFSGKDYEYEFAGNQTQITKQIGNAVPVRTARALIRSQIIQ